MGVNALIKGYRQFRRGRYQEQRQLFDKLAEHGQSPEVMMISCCDSRVDPAIIMEADPGELFLMRNVASLVPPFHPDGEYHGTSAALEFAVRHLKVGHIIVVGHAQCGGIQALYHGEAGDAENTDFIGPWMEIAKSAREHVKKTCSHEPPEVQLKAMEYEGVRVSLRNLMTFSWIADAVDAGALQLHGWYFDLPNARLLRLNPEQDVFEEIV